MTLADIPELVTTAVEQLLGRSSGPLHFRLILQPLVSGTLAIRAGIRDARVNNPPFVSRLLRHKHERKDLVRSAWVDVEKVMLVAAILDTVYQLAFLGGVFLLQTFIVVFVVAVLPYIVLRGPAARAARRMLRLDGRPSSTPVGK